jgi:hypothetical protein
MIDVFGGPIAVLAPVGIAQKHRSSIQRNPAGVRNPDELAEPDHRR